jgi:hypothetical protein
MKSRTQKDREKAEEESRASWDSVFAAYREGRDTLEMWRKAAGCHELYEILGGMEMSEFLDKRKAATK